MLIDRKQVDTWAKTPEAIDLFPVLLAKLIYATCPKDTQVLMPFGSGVFTAGYDGEVMCMVDTPFVPKGQSVWEFGTDGRNNAKALMDYRKRNVDPMGYDRQQTTFIFATPTFWGGKKKFAIDRRNEKEWKNFVAIDSTVIVQWLMLAPAVARWFSAQMGATTIGGIQTVDEFDTQWFEGEIGRLPYRMLTAGRDFEKQQLIDFLEGDPGVLAIKTSSKKEALAFIVAVTSEIDPIFNARFRSKTLILNHYQDLDTISNNKNDLNIIVLFNERAALHAASKRGLHLIVPMTIDENWKYQVLELAPVSRLGLEEGMSQLGFNEFDSAKYIKESGNQISFLRRLLRFPDEPVAWATPTNAQNLIPALLLGRWNETKEGDIQLLEFLSGKTYQSFFDDLNILSKLDSPPLLRVDNSWRLSSPFELWVTLSPYLSPLNFRQMAQMFEKVFDEVKDNFEIPEYPASKEIKTKYSREVRAGILQSLILISLYGTKLQAISGTNFNVESLVANYLYKADAERWYLLSHELPLIAEAAPNAFLTAVESSMIEGDGILSALFVSSNTAVLGGSNHHHAPLLWALEALAWIPEYFPRAVFILARLASYNLEINIGNTPLNSLKEILHPSFFQTEAPYEDRLEVFKALASKYPTFAWKFFPQLLSIDNFSSGLTNRMRWRTFSASTEYKFFEDRRFEAYELLLDLMLEIYENNTQQFADLIAIVENLTPILRAKLSKFLLNRQGELTENLDLPLMGIRKLLNRHSPSKGYHWQIPDIELQPYREIYNYLNSNGVQNDEWLFNDPCPPLVYGFDHDKLEEHIAALKATREDAVNNTLKVEGIKGVIEFAKRVKEKRILGETCATLINNNEDISNLCLEIILDDELYSFGRSFVNKKAIIGGIGKVIDLYNLLNEFAFDQKIIRIFTGLPQTEEVLNFISSLNENISMIYWNQTSLNLYSSNLTTRIKLIENFLKVERVHDCIQLIKEASYDKIIIPAHLIEKTLFKIAELGQFEGLRKNTVLDVFNMLNEHSNAYTESILKLEWIFLEYLGSQQRNGLPWKLYEYVANEPQLFVDMLKMIYSPEDGSVEDEKEEDKQSLLYKVRKAKIFFDNFRNIPGVLAGHIEDPKRLKNWVCEVRKIAKDQKRLMFADSKIGKLLATFPRTPKNWPPKDICEILEDSNSTYMLNSFQTEIFNSRGVTTRGAFSGGTLERDLIAVFQSYVHDIRIQYPKVTAIFRTLIDQYTKQAAKEDEEARRNRLDN